MCLKLPKLLIKQQNIKKMKTLNLIFKYNKTSNLLALNTIAVVLLSTIHHIYGGFQYDTSWRIIMPIFFFLPMLFITLYLQGIILKYKNMVLLVLFTLLVSIGWIGILSIGEGGYNHVLKNILYFGGASEELLHKMFPPEFGSTKLYEKPNNVFFEISGILTTVFGVPLTIYLYKFIKLIRAAK